jgi:type VI secretion system secreted protein Hcp
VAAVDYFLKIEGIEGESTDAKHKGEIELASFSWGETNQAPAAGRGGAGAGKVAMQDFHFVMRVNKASPKLMLACASGQHIKEAVLTARKAGKAALEFLVYKFNDLVVSSYQTAGSVEEPYPHDQVSFKFGRIQVEYRQQDRAGRAAGSVQAGWDLRAGRKV